MDGSIADWLEKADWLESGLVGKRIGWKADWLEKALEVLERDGIDAVKIGRLAKELS